MKMGWCFAPFVADDQLTNLFNVASGWLVFNNPFFLTLLCVMQVIFVYLNVCFSLIDLYITPMCG